MRTYLSRIFRFLQENPVYILWFLIIVFCLFVGYFALRVYRYRKAARAEAKAKDVPTKPEHIAPVGELPRNLLVLNHRLRLSFNKALKLLKSYFPERRFRYKLPWFVMIGEPGSGKSTMLRHSGLKLPLGAPEEEELGMSSPCKFWFFDQGVVLDLEGNLIFRKQESETKERAWYYFAKTLYRNRPERALDGVILTISVKDLMDFKMADRAHHEQKAKNFSSKLHELQETTGIAYPVYLVLTQSDLLPGFSEFCAELPPKLLSHIFGWSVPYDVSHNYASNWIDEGFEEIRRRIGQLQLEVAYKGFNAQARDGFFLFPERLDTLRESLKIYLDEIFTVTTFHDPLFMRGIYFTGEVTTSVPLVEDPDQLWSEPSYLLTGAEEQQDPFAPFETPRQETRIKERPTVSQPSFIRDLLLCKVFPECQVARPTRHKLKTQNRAVFWAKAVTIGIALTLTIGIIYTSYVLERKKSEMLSSLKGINQVLDSLEQSKIKGEGFDPNWFSNPNNPLFTAMNQLHTHRFTSLFLPTSEFSAINERVAEAVTVGYEKIMLDSLGDQLIAKAKHLTETTDLTEAHGENSPIVEKSTDIESFLALRDYFEQLAVLSQNIAVFNGLKKSPDIDAVQKLVRYCFEFEIPSGTLAHLVAMQIDFNKFEPIEFTQQEQASAKADKLFQRFADDYFNPADVLYRDQETLRSLLENQNGWMDVALPDLSKLRAISLELKNTERFYRKDPLHLFGTDEIMVSDELSELLHHIERSHHVKNGMSEKYQREFIKRYHDSKDRLDTLFLEEAIDIREPLRAFFGQPFLSTPEREAQTRENYLRWEKLDLYKPAKYYEAFQHFKLAQLDSRPAGGWGGMLRQLSITYLEQHINTILDREPSDPSLFDSIGNGNELEPVSEQSLGYTIQGFAQAYVQLDVIQAIFKDLGLAQSRKNLSTRINRRATSLLFLADQMLEEDLYNNFSLENWDGISPISPRGMGLEDTNDLRLYLDKSRNRIWHIGKDYAMPLVAILKKSRTDPDIAAMAELQKWLGIIEEIENFDEKRPYPAVRRLEVFFEAEINQINMHNYRQTAVASEASSNYFLDRINLVKRKIHDFCRITEERRHLANYTALQLDYRKQVLQAFDENLAGHYPFALSLEPSSADADQLRTFTKRFRDTSPVLRAAINYEKNPSPDARRALAFMDEMAPTLDFLEPFLARGREAKGITINTTLRVNRDAERKGNQILTWTLTIGNRKIHLTDGPSTTVWHLNEPISLSLRWAKDSPLLPRPIPGDPFYSVEGTEARFTYPGAWSLFRLLAQHQLTPPKAGLKPPPLTFYVPLQVNPEFGETDASAEENAVIFVAFESLLQGSSETLVLPSFPTQAPDLFKELMPVNERIAEPIQKSKQEGF